jgi:hypothetical protein
VFSILSSVLISQPNGGETWQATVGVQGTVVNMSNAPLLMNTGYFYDNGGVANNAPQVAYTQTLTPDNPLNKLQVTFTSWDIGRYGGGGGDELRIYDGPTKTTLLGVINVTGTNTTFTSTHSTGSLSVDFVVAAVVVGIFQSQVGMDMFAV